MSIALAGEQRDALYAEIVVLLSGVDDLWRAVAQGDFEQAECLGRLYVDALTFLTTDLGWGADPRGPAELVTEPDVLRRILTRIGNDAGAALAEDRKRVVDAKSAVERNRAAVKTCQEVLRRLDEAR